LNARAYAEWAGKRLPHEWEWQYAAQGGDENRVYPWGNGWNPADVPTPDKGRSLTQPDDVNVHPAGASPFGVMDLVGNVWQWTEEHVDDQTRVAFFAVETITSHKGPSGTFLRHTGMTSTGNCF
jgi:formylglycine-generating enzyme required for sulfatase activity